MKELKKDIPYLQYMTDSRSGEKIIVPDGQMRDFIAVAGTYDEHLLFFKPEEINPAKGTRVRIIGGDFAGYEGIFKKVKGARDRRVVICIQGIIAMAMATISPDLIEVIKDKIMNYWDQLAHLTFLCHADNIMHGNETGYPLLVQQILHIQFATVSDPHGKPLCFFTTKHTLGALTYVYLSVLQSGTDSRAFSLYTYHNF